MTSPHLRCGRPLLGGLCFSFVSALVLLASTPLLSAADEEGITWRVTYEGKALPGGVWSASGEKLKAKIEDDGALRLSDDGPGVGYYSAPWKAEPGQEIVVEATVKFLRATGTQKNRTTVSLWPWRDGAPVTVQVSDGRHQEGLVLFPTQAASFTDRFIRWTRRTSSTPTGW